MIQHSFHKKSAGSWFFTSRSQLQSFKSFSWLFRCWKVFDLFKFLTCSTGSISALRPSYRENWCIWGDVRKKLPWCCSPANPTISFIWHMHTAYIRNELKKSGLDMIGSGLIFLQLTGLVCLYLDTVLHGESQYLSASADVRPAAVCLGLNSTVRSPVSFRFKLCLPTAPHQIGTKLIRNQNVLTPSCLPLLLRP